MSDSTASSDAAANSDPANGADHVAFPPPTSDPPPLSGLALAGLGIANAAILVAGLALGLFVDSQLGTAPVFVLVGMASGIVLGVLGTFAQVRRYLAG